MESFLPLASFQLPFKRSLSSLYNNTKKSTDFIKQPVQAEEDPEIKALHRKLRIQNDRLVSWGLEWSDPSQSAEIDESLSKAGLSEVVASVMSTIKDILAEAEPLWLSSKRIVEGPRPSHDQKAPLVRWDKARFEDLVNDLTASIDTLYDLSRTRASNSALRRPSKPAFKSSSSTDEVKAFQSSRFQTPQQIDPQTLTYLKPMDPSTDTSWRTVVLMSKTAYSQFHQSTTPQPWAPLLLEYAWFDSIYSMTGIMPPMARFESFSAALQQSSRGPPGTWNGLPRLVSYFEDMENSRIGLVYRLPLASAVVPKGKMTQNQLYHIPSLRNLFDQPGTEPPLEAKFRLANNLVNTIFDLHSRDITHGNLTIDSVTFCAKADVTTDVDIRRPVVSAFDFFSNGLSQPGSRLYNTLEPNSTTSGLVNERIAELYSLALVLLSIGLWTDAENSWPEVYSPAIPESLLKPLTVRCGSLYAKAVELCWSAVGEHLSARDQADSLVSTIQFKVTRYLEACCILDGMSSLEERLSQEQGEGESIVAQASTDAPLAVSQKSKDGKSMSSSKDKKASAVQEIEHVSTHAENDSDDATKPSPKVRLFPQVPLPPDAVDKWNKILMPQINHALRHFYRKNPESVEISLESVGPSPQKTQPTILVVCTSVGKVRAILKKRLGDLFDGSTGFALRVCRGHVLRSRRLSQSVVRSMDCRRSIKGAQTKSFDQGNTAIEPVNPEFHPRPGNGASIGAWIGDRHLPPVSFGGLVMIDDKPYGMTVHHMLDDPEQSITGKDATTRSSGRRDDAAQDVEDTENDEDDFTYDLSDTESEPYSETDITSDYEEDSEEDEEYNEPGDIPGIEPGCGDGYIVTQPALDDVEDGFYPCAETEAEDHLDSFSLGHVFASSGIRRKTANNLIHEVDWALFEFSHERLPTDNLIPRAQDVLSADSSSNSKPERAILHPTSVAPSASLPGLEVQCVARTSGLQTGQILPALTSVKIYGRASPSHTYQVASMLPTDEHSSSSGSAVPMGIPGDSGAWVVDRLLGRLCGHILAWSQLKRVAYICPMDVLLEDIAQTLEASEVKLPGGQIVVSVGGESLSAGKAQVPAALTRVTSGGSSGSNSSSIVNVPSRSGRSDSASTSPMSEQLRGITGRLEDINIGGRRIDVTG